MGSRFCLLLLCAAGGGLLAFPQAGLHLRLENTWPILDLWLQAVRLVAVPVSLLLLGFTRSGVVRFFQLGWGVWLSLLSLGLLFQNETLSPFHSPIGLAAILLVLVTALGLTLFSTMQLFPPSPKKASA